jgi:hypothetical protein
MISGVGQILGARMARLASAHFEPVAWWYTRQQIGRGLRKYYEPPNDLPPRLFLLQEVRRRFRNFSSGQLGGQQASIDVGSRFVLSSFDRGDRGCEPSLPFRVLNRTSPLVRRQLAAYSAFVPPSRHWN